MLTNFNDTSLVDETNNYLYFYSYGDLICKVDKKTKELLWLSNKYNISTTTSKYRNLFLNQYHVKINNIDSSSLTTKQKREHLKTFSEARV